MSTAIQLSGMEQARAQLAFLQGDLDNLPEEVQSNIYAKVAQNDWTGALELYKQFKDKQVQVKVNVDWSGNTAAGAAARQGRAGPEVYRRASGGVIPGVGNSDSELVLATPGEYVIQKSAAQAIGLPMLERLNKGDKSVIADMGASVQRFANGGMVEASPVAPQVYRPTMTYADAGGSGATTAPSPQSGQMFGDVYITTTTPEELPAEMSRSALRLKALLG